MPIGIIRKAILVWDSLEETIKLAEVYLQLARLENSLKEYPQGLHYAKEAISIYQSNEEKNLLGKAHKVVGMIHKNAKHFDRASESYLEALKGF